MFLITQLPLHSGSYCKQQFSEYPPSRSPLITSLPVLIQWRAGRSQKTLLPPQNPLGVRLRQMTYMLSMNKPTRNLGSEGEETGTGEGQLCRVCGRSVRFSEYSSGGGFSHQLKCCRD